MISAVEKEYQARMNALSPAERVARSAAMFQWARETLARTITAEMGAMSADRLKWEVALRQYGAEPAMRAMIEELLQDVSR
jgi:hypothetical protein